MQYYVFGYLPGNSGNHSPNITRQMSCPDKSESLGFPQSGMKFDVVTQWMIAYAGRHIPHCRACFDVGEDGASG